MEENISVTPVSEWDDTDLRLLYANAFDVLASREEIALAFGLDRSWQLGQGESKVVALDRILLSPYAAKRLSLMLQFAVSAYESKYGYLEIGPTTVQNSPSDHP